jgi:hypothetical protein
MNLKRHRTRPHSRICTVTVPKQERFIEKHQNSTAWYLTSQSQNITQVSHAACCYLGKCQDENYQVVYGMDCRKKLTLFWIEIQKKTAEDAEQSERQHYHGDHFMHAHVWVEQIAVDHDEPGCGPAQHGNKSDTSCYDMALTEKLYRFTEMQAAGTLKSEIGGIKSKQDGSKLGKGMDAEDECHKFWPLNFFLKTTLI